MKEKAKNVKTDRKFWTESDELPRLWAEAQQVGKRESNRSSQTI